MSQSQTISLAKTAQTTTFSILLAVSFCHFLNDLMQTLLASIYPLLKRDYGLDFWQIGLLTMAFQVTASLLQPLIGLYTDKRPLPYSLPVGMASTLVGLFILAYAGSYLFLLLGASMIGLGSAIFHPESSRVARMASGGRYGLAQSVFQVGGNFGSAVGPLLAAFIVVPRGQGSVAWFSAAAFIGMIVLWQVSSWYSSMHRAAAGRGAPVYTLPFPRGRTQSALIVLALLVFTKNIYNASFASYYTFYVIERFQVTVQDAQLMLFVFLGAAAVGTVIGGPIGDRYGSKTVIWFSILGVLPFTLTLPYVGLEATIVLTGLIGLILSSAFPAIVVFAQELVPGRVGMIAGIFFGFAFGMGGIAAAVLGTIADAKGITFVYQLCSYLPLLGLLTVFLPDMKDAHAHAS
ncbi:MFS transporter [Tianweitania sp. BSSL-BM11]|uniref:MFS transporter n=1 Tax=Tianweitania aestuarii TaxID=2814886 RepID=A0ABS5RVN5_9HYPH|nr:MFS transporter [Tianweitania aestuarii]MBS9721069.1 MFS transporter [Tianweitania aestuarii]